MMTRIALAALALAAGARIAAAQAPNCPDCDTPQAPFKVFGSTYFVGTKGLSSVLITSDQGHVLIDGGLPESAAAIAESIRALGFRIEDVRLILNSHVHFDHAGGIAELQRRSGARVAASPKSAPVFRSGRSGPDDPQYGVIPPIAPVARVEVVEDGQTLRVGPLALTAHFTPGHTPGGTSWSWRSCEGDRCLDLVYADSLTAVSADGFLFTRSREYPNVVEDFEHSFAVLSGLPCDILLTAHPYASNLPQALEKRDRGEPDPFLAPGACRALAERSRQGLERRLADERAK